MSVQKVGNVNAADRKIVRIVHISDTHMQHNKLSSSIPDGDILIHSGDFSAFSVGRYFSNRNRDREICIQEMNSFFSKIQFKHKLFVAGNHELSFTRDHKEFLEEHLTEVTYLQDKLIELEGIKIYGTPWTAKRISSYARGFSVARNHLNKHWEEIPLETDILVTHMPAQGILDLGSKVFSGVRNLFSSNDPCSICGDLHDFHEHWGCKALKRAIFKRIRPTLHLFGHVHEGNGITTEDGVVFSNAAMKLKPSANVFDYYL